MPSRFFNEKDINTFDKFNKELVGNLSTEQDGIIYQPVVIYKVSAYDTEVNLYGETADGKVYKPGVEVTCLVAAEDQTTTTDEFGPDLAQTGVFSFLRQSLVDISYVAEIGDIIDWNYAYFEVNSINENKLLGGDTEKNHDLQAICHMTRRSKLNIEKRVK